MAEHGRLTLPALAHHSKVSPTRLRHGLATLIQQHLLLHYTPEEHGPTYYSVDHRNAYFLVRTGRVIELVEERYGEGAGQIVANLLQLGHAKVGDLADAYDLAPGSKRDSGIDTGQEHVNGEGIINGMTNGHVHTTDQHRKITTVSGFHTTLRKLLWSGFLVKVGSRIYQPQSDLQEELEEQVISESFPDRRVTGPKKQMEFKRAVGGLKRKWRETDEYSDLRDVASRGTIRYAGAQVAPNKRAKMNRGLPNGVAHYEDLDMEEDVHHSAPRLPVLCW